MTGWDNDPLDTNTPKYSTATDIYDALQALMNTEGMNILSKIGMNVSWENLQVQRYLSWKMSEGESENIEKEVKSMTRTEILEKAKDCVTGERGEAYGRPEAQFSVIAGMWTTYLQWACMPPRADVYLEAKDVAAMMALLEIARIAAGSGNSDHWVDLARYAACGGEIDGKEG